ncbi:Uncharacterized conserved protein, DUF58 family, contains vWF domain [Candidatus Fervidibacteria bacterium JGI MDM2 SSWTFF-3-K9]
MPTVRLALAFALGAIFWAFGLLPFAWAYNGVIVLAALWELFAVMRVRRSLRCERKVSEVMEISAQSEVNIVVANPTNLPLMVAVKDEPPSDFQWDAPTKRPDQILPLLSTLLPPRSRVSLRYLVTPMRRGEFKFGEVNLRLSTPLMFVWLPVRYPLPQTVRVLPNLAQARKYSLLMRKVRMREMGFRPIPLKGAGTEFSSLRDYLPDDDPRWIDWNATARRGRLVSKEFELERGQNIVAILDAGRVMATRLDGLTKLDHAVNAAAFVLFIAHNLEDRVGLMIFSDHIQRWLPPSKGVRQWESILEALRQVEPQLVEANYASAFAHLLQNLPRRSLLLIFTDLIDPDTSEALITHAKLLAEKHLVIVVALSDYELRSLLAEPIDETSDLYRQAAAVAVLNDRLRAVAQLRESGVNVLDTSPEALFNALLEHYLLAKRRL